MKIALALFLVSVMLLPGSAFGWKSTSYQNVETCHVNCQNIHQDIDHSEPFNFYLLGFLSIIGVGLLYKISRTEKFETFSLKCKHCGKSTNGLKCPLCEARKQKAM